MSIHITWPGQTLALFACAEEAMRQIPPAFPLAAAVAVNPWLGQASENRTIAAARLMRLGAGRAFASRQTVVRMIDAGEIWSEDLSAAEAAHGLSAGSLIRATTGDVSSPAMLPTLADLARSTDGVDWPGLIEERISHWAAADFDQGQAFWPASDLDAWSAWQAYSSRDLTTAIAGLSGFAAQVAAMPRDAHAAFADACQALDLTTQSAPLYFHRLLVTLSGWAQYARHLSWMAERDGGRDGTLFALLTIRLTWEVALLKRGGEAGGAAWEKAKAEYARPVEVDPDTIIDAALQAAVDHSNERQLALSLLGKPSIEPEQRPATQAAFCIDVRSERLRRALEAADPDIQTIGFAGFFGLSLEHRGLGCEVGEARAPILVAPSVTTRAGDDESDDANRRVQLRTVRAWGRFKRAAVSAFAFVEAAGPLYIGKLLRDGLAITGQSGLDPAPVVDMPLAERISVAKGILRAMSLTEGFARLVLICGHGAAVANAPHASALQCGACGGFPGDVNARVLAALLNDGGVRDGLAAAGIAIPADTFFIAGLHDTVSDDVRLFEEALMPSHAADVGRLRAALATAGVMTRTERARGLPRGTDALLARRGHDWSELRPEWGLAGCRGFVVAPRARTRGRDLGGEVFLHDYDWRQDPEAATLEMILSAPVVVASWIALQYHGAAVAPDRFGAGNKLLHNVVGGIGVLEGNAGPLRVGLPAQSLHDGDMLRHIPRRLAVAIAAPETMIAKVLQRQPHVRALFDNDWLSLAALDDAGGTIRRYEKGAWFDRHTNGVTARDAA
ncbi:YbcC family protein [Loktanella sp. DJP18]|uniref:YbcC family protein n=1 Tax=Loktanella sp. DJP18 TaxID=3409788 RepID=UPI003BB4FA58